MCSGSLSYRLQELAADDLSARYYLARWFTLEGKWDSAVRLLREVGEQAGDQVLTVRNPAVYGTIWFWSQERNLRRRALTQTICHASIELR